MADGCWIAIDSGNWNGDPTADPSTGAGGIPIGFMGGAAIFAAGCVNGGATGDILTANFGGAAFVHAIPAGASAYGATATFDPATVTNATLSGGNLVLNAGGPGVGGALATISHMSGFFYFELMLGHVYNFSAHCTGGGISLAGPDYMFLSTGSGAGDGSLRSGNPNGGVTLGFTGTLQDAKIGAAAAIVVADMGATTGAGTVIRVAFSVSAPVAQIRASQIVAEALVALNTQRRVSQLVAEIIVWNHAVSAPAIYPTLGGLGYSVVKRPMFNTAVAQAQSGREVRIGYYTFPLWEYELTYDLLADQVQPSDLRTLMGFWLSTSGNLQAFLFQDPDDNTVTGQALGTTDGVTSSWTIVRTLGGSDGAGSEPVGYVNTGATFNLYLANQKQDPSTYDVITTMPVLQQVRFHATPAAGQAITADFSFYYYVRFKDPSLDFEKFMNQLWSVKKVTLVSLRG